MAGHVSRLDDTDPLDQPVDHPLLGQRVRVTLARAGACADGLLHGPEDDDTACPKLTADETAVGTLTRLDAGGSFELRDDDGTMRYGWPALDIVAEPEVAP